MPIQSKSHAGFIAAPCLTFQFELSLFALNKQQQVEYMCEFSAFVCLVEFQVTVMFNVCS